MNRTYCDYVLYWRLFKVVAQAQIDETNSLHKIDTDNFAINKAENEATAPRRPAAARFGTNSDSCRVRENPGRLSPVVLLADRRCSSASVVAVVAKIDHLRRLRHDGAIRISVETGAFD